MFDVISVSQLGVCGEAVSVILFAVCICSVFDFLTLQVPLAIFFGIFVVSA